jgi:signal transduction histidine kinase
MRRLTKSATLARIARWANVGLLLVAVIVTALLAWRAHEAAAAHRSTAQQTLREYAAFAAFEVRNATLDLVATRQRIAMEAVLRLAATRPDSPLAPQQVADLVQSRASACQCLSGARFYFRMSVDDSAIAATPSPLATTTALHWFRDSAITLAFASRQRLRVAPPTDAGVPAILVPPYLINVMMTRVDGHRVIFASALLFDVLGRPRTAYGFAIDPEPYVGDATQRALQSPRVLPRSVTRGIPLDSILAVRVRDGDGQVVYQNSTTFDARYAAVDSTEARQGGFRFQVAINPAMVDRLVIGGMPRSRLPSLIGLFALSAGLLVLVLYQLVRQQELMRLRSEFVSGVSHELRTPLAQIRVLAELLRLGKIPDEERRERSLRIIDQEARRLTFLVESILDFSALDRDRVVPMMTDVAGEVEEIVTAFEPLASNHSVQIETNLERGLVANVDRSAMRQMLINLLDNAVRYGPDGQTVKVTTESRNGTWHLIVEDQGKGIPASERERIFEPYYRLNRDARGEKGGTGIGLAVVRGLVEKHGGQVTVDDAAARSGARFSLELPVAGPVQVDSR